MRSGCQELGVKNLDVDRAIQAACLSFSSPFPREGERVFATLAFLKFKLTVTAFSISILSRTLLSSKTKHR